MFYPTQLQWLVRLAATNPAPADLVALTLVMASVVLTIRGLLYSASKAIERNTPIYIARQISKTTDPATPTALSKAMDSYCGGRKEADPPKEPPPAIGNGPPPPAE